MDSNIPIIWTEGILAVGKSTFVKKIAEELNYLPLEEPVDTNFYLKNSYDDPRKFVFGMQILLLHYRYAMKQTASFGSSLGLYKGIILDRSIAGDRAFAKLHKEEGNIHPLDWRCYEYAYNMMAKSIQPPTIMIYLRVQPEVAYRRMKERGRPAEGGVSLDYLKKLSYQYEELIKEMKMGRTPWNHAITVHEIIWDRDVVTDEEWKAVAKTVQNICSR